MSKILFINTLCLVVLNAYSQKITLITQSEKYNSTIKELKSKLLKEINQWEINDKTTQYINSEKSHSAANDSTTSLSVILPNTKINIIKNTFGKKRINYNLYAMTPLEFFLKPIPFTDKIYSYETTKTIHSNIGLCGSNSTNFIIQSLSIDTTYHPLFLGYFLQKDRYWGSFLVKQNKNNELIYIDRQFKAFKTVEEYINYHYGSIEKLITFSENHQGNNILIIINDKQFSNITNNIPIIKNENVENVETYNSTDPKVKDYKDLWMYDVIAIEKLKPNVKLLTLKELYKHYNIKKKDEKLKICVDKKLVKYPQNLLIDTTAIVKVEIIKGKYAIETPLGKSFLDTKTNTFFSSTYEIINSKEKFINITTLYDHSKEYIK